MIATQSHLATDFGDLKTVKRCLNAQVVIPRTSSMVIPPESPPSSVDIHDPEGAALGWLELLKPFFPETIGNHWDFICDFKRALTEAAGRFGDGQEISGQDLLAIRSRLCLSGYGGIDVPSKHGGLGKHSALQMCCQFLCGYQNLDLRDVAHIGHANMLVRYGTDEQRSRWLPLILDGGLAGVALTEERGGSTVRCHQTRATRRDALRRTISGEKCWISRLKEAAVFVVFFKTDAKSELSAALIDPQANGFITELLEPSGLTGWSWGRLKLDDVPLWAEDFLGEEYQGMEIIRDHFQYYRPIVAATAVGCAASVYDYVTARLGRRRKSGRIDRYRDSAMEEIGRSLAQLRAILFSSFAAMENVVADPRHAMVSSLLVKAHSVKEAYEIVDRLSQLAGAEAFQRNSKVAKAIRDLRGYRYADGIHSELLRSAGRLELSEAEAMYLGRS